MARSSRIKPKWSYGLTLVRCSRTRCTHQVSKAIRAVSHHTRTPPSRLSRIDTCRLSNNARSHAQRPGPPVLCNPTYASRCPLTPSQPIRAIIHVFPPRPFQPPNRRACTVHCIAHARGRTRPQPTTHSPYSAIRHTITPPFGSRAPGSTPPHCLHVPTRSCYTTFVPSGSSFATCTSNADLHSNTCLLRRVALYPIHARLSL